MLRQILFLFLICFASLSAFAQTEKYTVPVKWERYKVSDKGVSILLPKLPVLIEKSDVCREQETKQLAAYADGTVYRFEVTSKINGKLPYPCSPQKKFDERNFQDRLTELKTLYKEFTETNFKQDGLIVNKIAAANSTFWLVNNFENKRWFELSISGEIDEKSEINNFIKSLELDENAQGIEINNGADRVLGDEIITTKKSKVGDDASVKILLKPLHKYTDAARNAQVQGIVELKITFLANGGIGDIAVIKSLPDGLTEQVIAAAQKIVFIPAKKNGIPYSTDRIIQYAFRIF